MKKVKKESLNTLCSNLVGCGTASYAALAREYLFSKIAGVHVNPAIGSEFGYHIDFLNRKSLVIAISQSGETMDILESVKKAKERRAKIACLTNVPGSSLYRLSDYKMLIGAGPEKAVASTKAFSGMLAHLVLSAYSLAEKFREGQKVLVKTSESAKKVLSPSSVQKIKKLAQKILNKDNVYVIEGNLIYSCGGICCRRIKTRAFGARRKRRSLHSIFAG